MGQGKAASTKSLLSGFEPYVSCIFKVSSLISGITGYGLKEISVETPTSTLWICLVAFKTASATSHKFLLL